MLVCILFFHILLAKYPQICASVMKNLRLIPDTHRQQKVIRIAFAFDKEVVALEKAQKSARWSQSLRSWYFYEKEFRLNPFYQKLKGHVFIDYSQLKEHPTTVTFTTKRVTSEKAQSKPRLPQEFKEQLILKRYSQNTIKTYCSCFLTFMAHFKDQPINKIVKEDIQAFLLHLIQRKRISPSTQNQYINAIKFYYEKVLKRPKIGNIVNPLEAYYNNGDGTIFSKNGSIEPLNERDKENKHHKGVYTQ